MKFHPFPEMGQIAFTSAFNAPQVEHTDLDQEGLGSGVVASGKIARSSGA
jgi:hypothetical protein